MGILEFIFGLIVFSTVVAFGATYVVGRMAWRQGRRLIGWVRGQKQLPGEPQQPSRAAQDVVVEPVDTPAQPQGTAAAQQAQAQSVPPQRDYVRLDVDDGLTPAKIAEVVKPYVADPVVGTYAQGVIDVLQSARMRRQSLFAELDGTFQRGSLSWEKFAAPSYAALDAILRNCALLGNRIQSFDTAGYLRLCKSLQQSPQSADGAHSQTRRERQRVFEQMIASLDAVQETNEGLLLELDKLAAELGSIQGPDASDQGDRIIDEIRRLVDEAKYYR